MHTHKSSGREGKLRMEKKMTSINRIWLPWLQMYSWEHRHPPSSPPAANTHTRTHILTRARARASTSGFFFFSCQRRGREGERGELRTKDADLMVAMCSQILQSRDRLLWEVGRSSGLVSLCTASSLTQAWSCRGGGKGGDSGAGCFPGPPHSLFLLELLLLPNLPECSTHPALNASFPRLFPRYCLQVLPTREKGIAKPMQAPPKRQLLDVVGFFFSGVPLSSKRKKQMAPVDKVEICNAYHWYSQKDCTGMYLTATLLFRFKMQEMFGRKNTFPVFQWSHVVP